MFFSVNNSISCQSTFTAQNFLCRYTRCCHLHITLEVHFSLQFDKNFFPYHLLFYFSGPLGQILARSGGKTVIFSDLRKCVRVARAIMPPRRRSSKWMTRRKTKERRGFARKKASQRRRRRRTERINCLLIVSLRWRKEISARLTINRKFLLLWVDRISYLGFHHVLMACRSI